MDGAVEWNVVHHVVRLVDDGGAVDTTFSDGVVNGDKAIVLGQADVGSDASGRKSDPEVVLVNAGLIVSETIAGLNLEGTIVARPVGQANNDGLVRINAGRNNGGCVRILSDIVVVKFDDDRVCAGSIGSVGDGERSIRWVAISDLDGGIIVVNVVGLIKGDCKIGSGEGSRRARLDRDVVLVVCINPEFGRVTSLNRLRLNAKADGIRLGRRISIDKVDGIVGGAVDVFVFVNNREVILSNLKGSEGSIVNAVQTVDGSVVCLGLAAADVGIDLPVCLSDVNRGTGGNVVVIPISNDKSIIDLLTNDQVLVDWGVDEVRIILPNVGRDN